MTWTKCLEVYDKDQVYPEYLVLYERLHGERPPEPPPKETRKMTRLDGMATSCDVGNIEKD